MKPTSRAVTPSSVLLLDLERTLEQGGAALSSAGEALDVISRFRTSSGGAIPCGLVADHAPPAPDADPGEIERLFAEYTDRLNQLGMAPYFGPADRRITLSTQAGAHAPGRAIFELALERLGVALQLDACVVVTDDAAHAAACSDLGMRALRVGAGGDFDDWSAGPLVIARALGVRDDEALLPALGLRLLRRYSLRLSRVDSVAYTKNGGTRVSAVVNLSADAPAPLRVTVTLGPSGDVAWLAIDKSTLTTSANAEQFLRMLQDNHRIAQSERDIP